MTTLHECGRIMARQRPGALAAAAVILTLTLLAAACGTNRKAGPAASASAPTPVPPVLLATSQPPAPRPSATSVATPSGALVTIDHFTFVPATITVAVGATVTWTNHDDVPHMVATSDKSFTSQNLERDAQFSHTFTTAGTFSYFCAIHPFMTANVIVQ